MFGRLLGWYTIYIFVDSCPLTEFCHVQNSLSVQVLRSSILAVHVTTARRSISGCLRRGTRNGITELFARGHFQQRVPPIFRARPSRWA